MVCYEVLLSIIYTVQAKFKIFSKTIVYVQKDQHELDSDQREPTLCRSAGIVSVNAVRPGDERVFAP